MTLQISWFVDIVPQNWALSIIFGGFIIGVYSMSLSVNPELPTVGERIPIFIIGAGSLIGIYNFHSEYPLLFIASIIFFAKFIEGLAAVRIYQKILYFLREGDFGYQKPVSFPKKIFFHLLVLFFSVAAVMTIVFLTIIGQIQISFDEIIRIGWVIFTICYTILGLSVKFKIVTDNEDSFNIFYIPTLVLIIAGAELYNIASLESEIYLFGTGILGYSIGYWYSVSELLKSKS